MAALLFGALVSLGSCALAPALRPSRGFLLDIPTPLPPGQCVDGRMVVVTAVGQARFRLNAGPERPVSQLAATLHQLLRDRAEKLVYVKAEPGVRWAEFIDVVDRVWPEGGVVGILTPGMEEAVRGRAGMCLAPSCGVCAAARTR